MQERIVKDPELGYAWDDLILLNDFITEELPWSEKLLYKAKLANDGREINIWEEHIQITNFEIERLLGATGVIFTPESNPNTL